MKQDIHQRQNLYKVGAQQILFCEVIWYSKKKQTMDFKVWSVF